MLMHILSQASNTFLGPQRSEEGPEEERLLRSLKSLEALSNKVSRTLKRGRCGGPE
jgi:hypothetical protein